MPATVLTHFYDEEVLLPYWLRHHREIFDHGVLVDRGSTDHSREIIRELTPDWDVVASRNPLFDARDTDLEMMDLERGLGGWKIVLNVTELLLHDDLRGHLRRVEQSSPETRTLGLPTVTMVDAPHEHARPLDDRALFAQRHHRLPASPGVPPYMRFLHREPHGDYGAGRHAVPRPYVVDDELAVLKYTWSPYPQVRERRLQIARGIPEADVRLGLSWGLFFTADELDEQFAGLSPCAVDLREDSRVAPTLERLARGYARRTPEPVPRPAPGERRRVAVVGSARSTRELGEALAAVHDVRCLAGSFDGAAGWAEIVVAELAACDGPTWAATHGALVVDVRGCEPADAGELLLLRGDFFVWDAERANAWIAVLAHAGRIADERDAGAVRLLGAGVAAEDRPVDVAERLAPFLRAPRRATARVAHDEAIAASRIGYYRRHKAALDAVLITGAHLIEAVNENGRLREENARLHGEIARLRDAERSA